jgi:pimeloyl-ACP methyl ester carboxylesterase
MTKPRHHGDDLRGAARLAVSATQGVVGVVEDMHRRIGSGPRLLGQPLRRPTELVTAIAYGAVREVTGLVGLGLDKALGSLAPFLGSSVAGPQREAALAVLCGVVGDTLAQTGNPLAIAMQLRSNGQGLMMQREVLQARCPEPCGKLLVLIHGSCMNDLQWNRRGHDHGIALARDLGFTPLYLHYNSGLHISSNGRALAEMLENLTAAWPQVHELTLLGHSMGGLVARSACHAAEVAGHRWRRQLRSLVCLGSPHHGAPLERGGSWIDVMLNAFSHSQPLARLGKIRSAGVTDLRYGYVTDEHWQGRDRFAASRDLRSPLPLPKQVRCYALAARLANPHAARSLGDGLVTVESALGRHARRELTLEFPPEHQWICEGAGHLDLLDHAEVYGTLRRWLT